MRRLSYNHCLKYPVSDSGLRLAAACWLLVACAAQSKPPGVRGSSTQAPAAGSGGFVVPPVEVPTCPPENPFCMEAPIIPMSPTQIVPSMATTCSEAPLDLTPLGVNVMIAVDGSASMNTHWAGIQAAITALRRNHPNAAFGVHVFWGEPRSLRNELAMNPDLNLVGGSNNPCGLTHNQVLDVGTHDDKQLLAALGDRAPGPSYFGGLFEISPVVDPINYYLKNSTQLADPKRTNYLLLITDGNDNCFGSVFARKADKLIAYEKLAVELQKLNIRTIPVGFDAASMPDSDGRFGTVKPNTDLEVLGTLLKFGGSGLPEVPKVDDPSKLAEVITQVGKSVRSCRFAIPEAFDPAKGKSPFELTFNINGKGIMRDRLQKEGWNFVQDSTQQVELYGQSCQAIQAGQALKVGKSCSKDICGSAVVKVDTRPRAVLMMLDGSASRLECADGSSEGDETCIWGSPRTNTFWEVVAHAVSGSLAAPINDDVEFGVQFFPSKKANLLSCDVETAPEVTVKQGTEITIMQAMLEKLPLGMSPVVQVLENVAASPGRLAEPGVLGALVLLSDGGDNCSGAMQAEVVQRLGSAAKSLSDRGVKTYVVRYGSEEARTQAQDQQLRAIVMNAGTAMQSAQTPSAPPYIEAKSEAELTAALAAISDKLATCSFALQNVAADADKDKTNLYLNGEAIAFDATRTKSNGWGWGDTARTLVDLYGDACSSFKSNRHTSVVVEFGCPQVTLF